MKYEIAIIIPTFNEVQNIRILLDSLEKNLKDISWEAIIVDDDSPDGTADIAFKLTEGKPNIRCIKRIGRRGLSSAVIEGMMSTNAPYIAVMDADLQHDETLLKTMLEEIYNNNLDIVVASRFIEESRLEDFSASREKLSNLGNYLANKLIKSELKDPLSGYFMLKKEFINEVVHSLSGQGFKILLDIFASANRPIKYKEIPFTFKKRRFGDSKLDTLVSLEFIMLFADKLLGNYLPIQYVLFILIVLFGIIVHLISLGFLFKFFHFSFIGSQVLATFAPMTTIYFLNNLFTYRDKRLRNSGFIKGLLLFCCACSIGAFINFLVANSLYENGSFWLIAGFGGGVISSVWNYAVNSTFNLK